MKVFEFVLAFSLADQESGENFLDRLYEAGCDDAIVGIGRTGSIAIDFGREAESAHEALTSAIRDVKKAIPHARLIEATPDLVGISDLAELLGFSRQNMRKLILSNPSTFPLPVHEGQSSLWHLCQVLEWFKTEKARTIEPALLETAYVTMQLNIARESMHLDHAMALFEANPA